ncbi:amidohydrolase family protein [soil metagenome]
MRTLIGDIGQLVTGDIAAPLSDADSILAEDGLIVAVGRGLSGDADIVIDAAGATAIPGLIDSHSHPALGDFTPRQRTLDVYESALHGGVTTAVSAGEPHVPGRPRDVVGLKALAILAARAYATYRPGGVKVHAGAPILEEGLTEENFIDLAAAGVRRLGEIGLGSVRTGEAAAPMVAWARAQGMVSTIHTGGPSLPGSSAIDAGAVMEAAPDIVGHVNGGTTSLSEPDIERLAATEMAIEIVHNGNGRTALTALAAARAAGGLDQVILGTDSPSGSGVVPLGMLRLIAHLSALGGIAPEVGICLATGNSARVHRLDVGLIAPGRPADICLIDAPSGSVASTALEALAIGDLPGISLVLVDGRALIGRSRNTPPAARAARVVKGAGPAGGGH